ncbi:MAG: dTMP kinase [Anaerolineales bacterium]|nr:dTMP kinase [Anaerolineales bacterium]
MFITLEGPDGSGKTTQIQRLFETLEKNGFDVLLTREPGGTRIGDLIRTVLHDPENVEMDPATEILLYSASRAQLVAQVIRPALAAGTIVLCDRYADSTMAYQGYGRQLDLVALNQITSFATGNLKPDLTLLLDVNVQAGLNRRKEGGEEWNRMDQQTLEFHQRTREGYKILAAAEPERWILVDASRTIDQVAAVIWSMVIQAIRSS